MGCAASCMRTLNCSLSSCRGGTGSPVQVHVQLRHEHSDARHLQGPLPEPLLPVAFQVQGDRCGWIAWSAARCNVPYAEVIKEREWELANVYDLLGHDAVITWIHDTAFVPYRKQFEKLRADDEFRRVLAAALDEKKLAQMKQPSLIAHSKALRTSVQSRYSFNKDGTPSQNAIAIMHRSARLRSCLQFLTDRLQPSCRHSMVHSTRRPGRGLGAHRVRFLRQLAQGDRCAASARWLPARFAAGALILDCDWRETSDVVLGDKKDSSNAAPSSSSSSSSGGVAVGGSALAWEIDLTHSQTIQAAAAKVAGSALTSVDAGVKRTADLSAALQQVALPS